MSSPIRPPAPDRQRPFFLVLLGTALLQAAVATWSGLRSEPLDVDAGRHLFTGAFLFDLIREMPHDPRGFALAYYVRFPAVGILHWPPLFHAVEAASFFLFGIGRLGPQLILGAASVTGVIYAWRAALRLTGSPA